MNYYEHHLGDYARDTTHLTALEHGVYRLLLDRYYTREEGIPEDQAYRVALARSDDERAAVDAVLSEYFKLTNGLWVNNKAEEEIEKARARINAAQSNGKRGGRPKKNPDVTQEKPNGLSVGSETETQTKAHQSPTTRHQTPIEIDDDSARGRLDRLAESLRDAAGGALDETSIDLMVLTRPLAWLADGYDLEADVLPTIRAAAARASPQKIRSWKYFEQAIADAKATRLAPMPEGRPDERTHHKTRDATVRDNHFAGILQAVAGARGT